MSSPVIILDRDGTLIVDRNYLASADEVEILPRAVMGLRLFQDLGCGLLVVTNQSGIARGLFSWRQLETIHSRLIDLLAAEGIALEGIHVCPHGPDDACRCRKPLPGLVEQASRDLGFDPREAIVIGDKACDVELGRAIGATSILVRTGEGARTERGGTCHPDWVADDLLAAAEWVQLKLRSTTPQRSGPSVTN